MKYELVDDENVFEKGDEMFEPYKNEWSPIPKQWIGMIIKRDNRDSTFARFNIQIRRLRK